MSVKVTHSVVFCAKYNLCTGCGLCEDACPNQAITIQKVKDLNKPIIDLNKCKNSSGCSRCWSICAGHGWDLVREQKKLFESKNSFLDDNLGFYRSCFVGHSIDENIRLHCASGGCVSTFLIYLLDNGFIQGALVTGFSKENPTTAEPFIATTKEEILYAKSSKYCPVTMVGMVNAIKNFEGKVAIVGIPCQIQAFRKYASLDKRLSSKIFACLSLFCSSIYDYSALNFIFKKNNIKKENIETFAYRDDGCPGSMVVGYKEGMEIFKVGYKIYKKPLRSFFKPERCLSCIDHFGMLADISFGDIHVSPYNKDIVGSNSIVVRSKEIGALFDKAVAEKYIAVSEIDNSEIIRAQTILSYRKKVFWGHRYIEKLFRRPLVTYDVYPTKEFGVKNILMDIYYRIQRLVKRFVI